MSDVSSICPVSSNLGRRNPETKRSDGLTAKTMSPSGPEPLTRCHVMFSSASTMASFASSRLITASGEALRSAIFIPHGPPIRSKPQLRDVLRLTHEFAKYPSDRLAESARLSHLDR